MSEDAKRVAGIFAQVWLDHEDISVKISPYLTSLEYSDDIDGDKGDKIVVKLKDTDDGLFQSKYYPKKGSALRFEFGFDTQEREAVFRSEHGFEIDEIAISWPDTVSWTANSNKPAGAIHTRKSKQWENTTLGGIANAIAGANGILCIFHGQSPNIPYISQTHESDYKFIKRLAEQYGLAASLKGAKGGLTLVVADPREPLGSLQFEINRESVTNFSFSDKAIKGKAGGQSTYWAADKKKEVAVGTAGDGDGHVIRTVAVQQSPEAHIQGTSGDAKKNENTNTLTLPGNPRLLAGVLVNLTGWWRNDGEWLIMKSKHTLDVASGYKTTVELRRHK